MKTARIRWSAPILEKLGYKLERAKTNIGLGRITNRNAEQVLRGGGPAMTNTLHRFGDAESFRDDYVVFAIASRGKNEQDCVPKLKKFLEMARRFNPVNLGDARHGGALRPSRSMNPLSHWNREITPDFDAVIAGLDTTTTAAAVFDNRAGGGGLRQGGQEGGSRSERQYLDIHRWRGAVLRFGESLPPQRGVLARVRGKDGAPGQRRRPETGDDVRARHGERVAGQEDDRLGEGRAAHTRAGGVVPDPVLFLRRIQSVARKANSGRGADTNEVVARAGGSTNRV